MTIVRSYVKNNLGFIAMNHPEKRNALTVDLVEKLVKHLHELDRNEEVKAIILYGEGKAFSAGGDLETIGKLTNPGEVIDYMNLATEVVESLRKAKKYVISAINGVAAGAGISLALASDFIVMERNAKFVAGFNNIALLPDLGLIKLLVQSVSPSIVKEWLSSGRPVSSEELYTRGIVNHLADGNLLEEAAAFAEKVTTGSPITNQFVKMMVNNADDMSTETYLLLEQVIQGILLQTADHKEGVRGFIEKRSPSFTGKW